MKNTMELNKMGLQEMSTQDIVNFNGGGIREQVVGWIVGTVIDIVVETVFAPGNGGKPTTPPKPNPHACDNV